MTIEFALTRLGVDIATDSNNNQYTICDDYEHVYINGYLFSCSDLQALVETTKNIAQERKLLED